MSRCRDCGEPVLWMTDTETGRKMPFDAIEKCITDGPGPRVIIDGEMTSGKIVGDAFEGGYSLGHTVHWDTCGKPRKRY